MSKESLKQFKNRLKFVRFTDILSFFPMMIGLFLSLFIRIGKKNVWLICERKNEARDNGYWFFKYLCENHKEVYAVYAINKKSPDYEKVKAVGRVIRFGSIIHWAYYFFARWNVSSQKEGKPNAAICFVLEVYLGFRKNRAYIRHGIAKDKQRWVYYDVTKIKHFSCASTKEFDFVKENFGYPIENVKLVGLCRYDNLLTSHTPKRQIIVMPTMREWLRTISSDTKKIEGTSDVSLSEFFVTWNAFLNNEDISRLLEQNNIKLLFYPHSTLQKYLHLFKTKSSYIEIISSKNYDVQSLLKESSVLITDYSSVFFDFAYMKKPTIYYQFDYEKYRTSQYQEGYFSYQRDGFGAVVHTIDSLIAELTKIIDRDFSIENVYSERVDSFFAFHDNLNCERTFKAINER